MWMADLKGLVFPCGFRDFGKGHEAHPDVAPDGRFGDLPSGPGERVRNGAVGAETHEVHALDEMPRDIGIAADGRDRLDGLSDRGSGGIGGGLLLPVRDRLR